jgi:hypothetical protein
MASLLETFRNVCRNRNRRSPELRGQPIPFLFGKIFAVAINSQHPLMRFLPDDQVPKYLRWFSLHSDFWRL